MAHPQLPRSEEGEQIAFAQYLKLLQNKGQIVMFTAIPNSTWTPSEKQKATNKAMGLHPGFPDLIIITQYRVVCIEMKVGSNKPTSDQLAWGQALNEHGVETLLCYGFDGAKQAIDAIVLDEKLYPPNNDPEIAPI